MGPLLMLFFAVQANAVPFKMAGTVYHFLDKEGLLVHGCEKKCEALKAINSYQKIDLKKIRKNLNTANSIGSDVCAYVYKEKAIIGISSNQDRRAFCLFPDKSMVELNSLEDYLVKKNYLQK